MTFKDIQQHMITWRRDLHRIPELGNELPRTVAYVEEVLKTLGIAYRKLVGGNALVGIIEGTGSENAPGKAPKCIGLRADMDGLPIREETGHPFSSTTGNMHACGHDGHTAMLLGAAAYLSTHTDAFSGTVKLLFQPGEEYPGGAKPMIDEGALKDPEVTAVFGLHNGHLSEDIPDGNVGFKHGAMMAAPDRICVRVNGKGSHAAYPEQSKDPVVITSALIMNLQGLISREKKATEPAVLSICRIEGGSGHNVIPGVVEFEGTVRTTTPELRQYYKERIQAMCDGFAQMHGIDIDVEHEFAYPPLMNDVAFTDLAIDVARTVMGADHITIMTDPVMGGEDMAYFLQEVPGTYAFLCNPKPVDGIRYPHHHPKFDIEESAFEKGAQLLARTAIRYLEG